ncbi:zinc ABC transporter ATP-binding protein AztA [uncultured Microbacterium sp.]|uniref:zinc ABC transporter ATP-binding protein AztA n=1 Tax=uncultured Microbacterium sp. TaxID=191216 RepID=UPI0028DC68FD|nr:zinc ABC transporter ATP-binding protein AztA [uncultured Microbacterium sp.]
MFPHPLHPGAVARLDGIRVAFDGRDVLHGVDVEIEPGAITVIAGPNGAGKSTLLEVLAGTLEAREGRRVVTGEAAFVPQRAAVSERLPVSARDVVAIGTWGRRGSRTPREALRMRVDDALDRLGILPLAARPFATLSGGQQQRALLAQGVARGADLLLLDEPTTGLDAESGARIRAVLRAEADRGVAVVCVSHDPAVLADADRIIRLADGRVTV